VIDLRRIAGGGQVGKAASEAAIASVQSALGPIPEALVELWRLCDGFYLNNGVLVYSTDDIRERNETYPVEENARDYLLIGDDSGGGGFLLHRAIGHSLFKCDLGFLDSNFFYHCSDSFAEWILHGCPEKNRQ
jgi:hypothetical protein